MNCFFASFVPGMEDLVKETVEDRLGNYSIKQLLEGAVVFETELSYDKLNFFCFNNIFAVIDMKDAKTLDAYVLSCLSKEKKLTPDSLKIISENSKNIKSFRMVFSVENTPVNIKESLRSKAEDFICCNSELTANRSKADTEFYFLYRREGMAFFMKRLTRSFEKNLHSGELSPPLAWLLCRLAGLKASDTVLDPFCGYGAIAEAALKYFAVKKCISVDNNTACIKICNGKKSLQSERSEIHKKDFFDADFFSRHLTKTSFDAIVTDPPWGDFKETKLPKDVFYKEMLSNFSRLLKPKGRAVILLGAGIELNLSGNKLLELDKSFNILVSGKKAVLYLLSKK